MTEVQRKYLEWVGYNDYEIQEVEKEIENSEEPLVFEGNQFFAWESGYNKANEWHYVKDGDLPSEEGGWVCNQNGLPCYFDWSTEQWFGVEGTQVRTTGWCNMPHKESE